MTNATHPYRALMNITARPPVVFVRGEGSYLWDALRQALSRFRAGLGRQLRWAIRRRSIAEALRAQADTAADTEPGLLQRPSAEAGASAGREQSASIGVLHQFSGAEANEGAIKLARKYGAKSQERARSKSSPSKAAFTAARSRPCRRPARRRSSRCSSRRYRASARPGCNDLDSREGADRRTTRSP